MSLFTKFNGMFESFPEKTYYPRVRYIEKRKMTKLTMPL